MGNGRFVHTVSKQAESLGQEPVKYPVPKNAKRLAQAKFWRGHQEVDVDPRGDVRRSAISCSGVLLS